MQLAYDNATKPAGVSKLLPQPADCTAVHCQCHSPQHWLRVWVGVVVSASISINEVNLRWAWLVLGWVTMSGVQLLVLENLSQYISSHLSQLSLAIPTWVGAMSTTQRAVIPCGWRLKTGVLHEWVTL